MEYTVFVLLMIIIMMVTLIFFIYCVKKYSDFIKSCREFEDFVSKNHPEFIKDLEKKGWKKM